MTKTPEPAKSCYFMAAATAFYKRDDVLKERSLNVILALPTPNITKAELSQIQTSVLQRLHHENNVSADMVQDVIILNVNLLGVMTTAEFEGAEEAPKPH